MTKLMSFRYLLKYGLTGFHDPAKLVKAIKHFRKSLVVSPRDPVSLRNLANLIAQVWYTLDPQAPERKKNAQRKFLDFLWGILLEVRY